jgi:pyruvate,water dikinase
MDCATRHVLDFGDTLATEPELVGGKGANLGRLASAGFNVPAGFTVTTDAYREFVAASGLQQTVLDHLAAFDYGDLEALERDTARLRAAFTDAPIPQQLTDAVTEALEKLGTDTHVAVRSSGTAEDLAEASFAGQHDTYLDVRGTPEVLDAVRRCWASMWTARAVAYRHHNGIDSTTIAVAVVVQTMVSSEVSGVLFTGNPMTAATDEMVINASWGLGEAIVSGLTQPDEYVLTWRTLKIKDRALGGKSIQIVRSPSGQGTVEQEVAPDDRARHCLSDDQAAALGRLGRQVTEYYAGIPQDIEWALVGDDVYLLQARPITGVRFSWDEQVDGWQPHPQDDVVWTRSWADAYNGPATPLFYSYRIRSYCEGADRAMHVYGLTELARKQWFKYHRGVPYYQGDLEAPQMVRHLPRGYRLLIAEMMTPATREATLAAPWKLRPFLRTQARGFIWDEWHSMFTFLKALTRHVYEDDTAYIDGLPAEELRALSDDELVRHSADLVEHESEYCRNAFQMMVPMALGFGFFNDLLKRWYHGDNPNVATELMTGTPKRTATSVENLELWHLVTKIRSNASLRALFDEHHGGAFFEAAAQHDEGGREWTAEYNAFLARHAHRGHSERDIYHPRRSDDPTIDYNAITTMLSVGPDYDPEAAEERANRRREVALAEVLANMRRGPTGRAKATLFTRFYDQLMKGLILRDDERYFIDRLTMSIRRAFLEIGARLTERGAFDSIEDVFFLTVQENYDLLRGNNNPTLTRAKIAGRRANYLEVESRSVQRPPHLQYNRPLDLTTEDIDDSSGTLRGTGTSGGTYTGRAHIIKQMKDIGQVQQGEILICNATDPGWTPVFLVIGAVVVETGGMLAHAACLAREYGFPAVQLPSALDRIPDGATITVNGDNGQVIVVEAAPEPALV